LFEAAGGDNMAFRRSSRNLATEMNVANLVDVTFALLIIFMITAPLMSQGVKVDLPKVEAKNIEVRDAVRVSISKSRKIYIEDQQVSLFAFDKEFRTYFSNPDMPVILNADRLVPYGFVVEVINKLQKIGVVKLSFLTELPAKIQE
jgi:biopolymer transport protein ExbD/biopolymer transport protein TolR